MFSLVNLKYYTHSKVYIEKAAHVQLLSFHPSATLCTFWWSLLSNPFFLIILENIVILLHMKTKYNFISAIKQNISAKMGRRGTVARSDLSCGPSSLLLSSDLRYNFIVVICLPLCNMFYWFYCLSFQSSFCCGIESFSCWVVLCFFYSFPLLWLCVFCSAIHSLTSLGVFPDLHAFTPLFSILLINSHLGFVSVIIPPSICGVLISISVSLCLLSVFGYCRFVCWTPCFRLSLLSNSHHLWHLQAFL